MRDYKSYYVQSAAGDLADSGVWPAAEFAQRFLGERNLILNVSAVLWRREALLAALRSCGESLRDWRIAGDWRLYLEVLTAGAGEVVYVAAPLNAHRRHAGGVTQRLDAALHVREIHEVQAVAAEKLGLDAAARARQAAYLAEVSALLGVPETGKARPARRRAGGIVARGRKV